jgi:hypothetical protein
MNDLKTTAAAKLNALLPAILPASRCSPVTANHASVPTIGKIQANSS